MALYANDLLLFPNDAGTSLQDALQVLASFSTITGLKGSWAKSLLFVIDPETIGTASPNIPLQWVERLRYLGIEVSRQALYFLPFNLAPILQDVRLWLKAWKFLPLSLLGWINPLKKKILLKFIYLFNHSPRWIPKSLFICLDRLFSSFLWGSHTPRYKLSTRKRPSSQGGLAFPDCFKYFLATQLVTAAWWLNLDLTNPSTLLEAAVVNFLVVLKFLLFKGPHAPYPLTLFMITTLRAWIVGLTCECYPRLAVSLNAPCGAFGDTNITSS